MLERGRFLYNVCLRLHGSRSNKSLRNIGRENIKVALFTTTNLSNIKIYKDKRKLAKQKFTLLECFTSKCSITRDIALNFFLRRFSKDQIV